MEFHSVSGQTKPYIDIHATSGPKSLYEASIKMAVEVLDLFKAAGAGYSSIIKSRGTQALQLKLETVVPTENHTQAEKDVRKRIIEDNNEVRKRNISIEAEASQCSGWILRQLDTSSQTLVLEHPDWTLEATADNNGCLRNSSIDLQRFVKLLWRIKTGLQDRGVEKIQTMSALDEFKFPQKGNLEAFAAQYGQLFQEAKRAGNIIDESSMYRTSHFFRRTGLPLKTWNDFLLQYGGNIPDGLNHTDVMKYIRHVREQEALVSQTPTKTGENSSHAAMNGAHIESAHVGEVASNEQGCQMCASLRLIAPDRISQKRVSSHEISSCSIGAHILEAKNRGILTPPTSRFNITAPRTAGSGGRGGAPMSKKQRSTAAAMLANGKEPEQI
jgi:hypothetical protein